MRKYRSSILLALLMLVLCGSIIVGSTLAYFTSEETSGENIIAASTLEAGLDWAYQLPESESGWQDAANGVLFNETSWEPNYSAARYIRIKNGGSLAFSYELNVLPTMVVEGGPELMDVIDVYFGVVDAQTPAITRSNFAQQLTRVGTMTDLLHNEHGAGYGILLPEGVGVEKLPAGVEGESGSVTACIVLHMQQEAGNEYMGLSAGEGFKLQLAATQYNYEPDAFGMIPNPTLPEVDGYGTEVVQPVGSTQNGILTADVAFTSSTGVTATVPAGAKVDAGVTELKLIVTPKAQSDADVTLQAGEALDAWEVRVEGLAKDNTVPVRISLGAVMQKALNIGNYDLYHVEGDATNKMTRVDAVDADAPHNSYSYDPATGEVEVAMATFSEVAMVASPAKWQGEYDYTWYDVKETEYIIANADQLAGFSAIVGGMDGQTQDSFDGKTVKLIADIDLNDGEENNDTDWIFYPIGYYNSNKNYEKVSGGSITSDLNPFEGTFDGNGHTIKNIYQNTWEMFGDYNNGYTGTPNHYKDGMGLFGRVVNGKVCNLTVDNFISDGEFTPTGVIAAYAVDSTFENIAITKCNPRVYNTGNGGIVGIGGNPDDPDTYKLTFTNITIDNTNKITALWGSWDVACGGLVGMFRGDGYVYMTNCHVAAQMDVYNDVCGNYQYYWYRYSGMMVGTNMNMTTDDEGYTVPETNKFHAEGCTVHFGEWNDYYYCELVANSLASYTHDHQFSRLTEIESLDEIKSGDTWLKAGNFLLINGDSKTCYHIVNKDGTLTQHLHTDAGTETVNGAIVNKEDKTVVYLPFDQLFTGYGWGVKHVPVYNGEEYAFDGITILDRHNADSILKFDVNDDTLNVVTGSVHTIGEFFKAIDQNEYPINNSNVYVSVSPVSTEENTSTATAKYEASKPNWQDGTLTFEGIGNAVVIIQDYDFCTPTTLNIVVQDKTPTEKFETKFTGDFLYRVGNQNTVKLDSLFKAKDGVEIGTVSVTIEAMEGTGASGTYTSNATWTNGTIQFSGTGVVKVTIADDDVYCVPTVLELQVVDAVNVTAATSATTKNVVLLNDCGFNSLEVTNGYALYGNGFTMTCTQDSVAADLGYSFVTLDNGTLDNVQIVCPNFDYAALYKSNLTGSDNRSETDNNGKTRYYNAKSGVKVSGNSQILNSRVSGGRAAVNVTGGNALIDNSRIELGAVANILVGSANSLVLRDMTLVQKPTLSTYDNSKTLMGFSVLVMCNSDGTSTPVTLDGAFIQNAWINEQDKQYVPTAGKSLVNTVLAKTEYLHDIDGDSTNESLNLGIAYMPDATNGIVNKPTILDNRTEKDAVPYDYTTVTNGATTYVYSYKNSNGTDNSFKIDTAYVPNKYSDIVEVHYDDTSDGLSHNRVYTSDGWAYELNVDLDKLAGYAFDFNKLNMTINGIAVTDFKVDGNTKPTSSVAVVSGGVEYHISTTVNSKEYAVVYKVIGTETSKESPSLVASNYEAALLVGEAGNTFSNDTWHGAAPVLNGIQIKYWSVAEKQYKIIALSDYTPTTAGKQNGTNADWTYTPANGDFTLTIKNETAVHSSNSVYAMPVVCNSKLYFVASGSKGLVNYGNSARTIKINYYFKDNNGGNELKFDHTWSIECANGNTAYDYSDFCNGTSKTFTIKSSNGSGCVAPDTLVTLSDGNKKQIQYIGIGEQVLAWNFYTGSYEAMPVSLLQAHSTGVMDVLLLHFSDGTELKVLGEHGIFDAESKEFVFIDKDDAAEYVGRRFLKQDGDGFIEVELTSYTVVEEATTAYTILSADHYNVLLEDLLTVTPAHVGANFFNPFDINEDMKYDEASMKADIEKYGLYTYEDFAHVLTEEQFETLNLGHFKVSVGKGLVTYDGLIYLIETFINGDF